MRKFNAFMATILAAGCDSEGPIRGRVEAPAFGSSAPCDGEASTDTQLVAAPGPMRLCCSFDEHADLRCKVTKASGEIPHFVSSIVTLRQFAANDVAPCTNSDKIISSAPAFGKETVWLTPTAPIFGADKVIGLCATTSGASGQGFFASSVVVVSRR